MLTTCFFTAYAHPDSSQTTKPTKAQMLVGGQWKIKTFTASPAIMVGSIAITNVLSLYSTCLTDNYQIFGADGVYLFDEGKSKCAPTLPQRETGTWTLSADETEVILNMPSNSHEVWEIPALSSTEATTRTKMVINGSTYTMTATLVKVN